MSRSFVFAKPWTLGSDRDSNCPPDAQDEALNAALHYQEIEPGLGDDLWRQYRKIIEALTERPERYPLLETIRTQTIRGARLKRFPYMLVYEIIDKDVFVLAFAHTARRPNYWRSRRGFQ